ncbi:MAG TPA: serine/threonine protein kinase [Cyanobacteria bacterium UBA11149]|nr:serine/threonine protein kinase [Cyanobacteria bacterium UBA11367]HBE57568.1 serine/threonine protein kinase [Cyanobacteria bacterium UBA11366]HBK64320.1 serine/threonine protein kinase [Cyanobacteria bacterium UBA11166]HBR73296.1 serine/threonine protein kinase [Cyanobacteria bacterium UBA11159]HBS67756.1 serine/threonine protein kinase [Cyanobacteria bacterium UBA11153]HBW92035.1 serine/threonine protein kinase [Cyanobacteria bacterium UBA11149]HCA97965.1 serine/threonine protein kinase 
MNFVPENLSSFYSEVLEETQLGRLCGQTRLFQNRYEVLRLLGRGGFGVTFLARDVSLPGEPLCVIKQLCPKVNDSKALENARVRFEREAKTLGKLGSHSQIPMLLNYFVADGEFYLVQEYVHGVTLARLVRRHGCLPESAVKRFLFEILPLLEYIHKHKVIHRDIKPQNIIRCQDDGRLVLIDFGAVKEQIAQAVDSTMRIRSTHFIGTVGFAPPEQFCLRAVFASDIYAIGITCLYLLSGKGPLDFNGEGTTAELYRKDILRLSEPFAKILIKMIQISLEDRYKSANEILRDLNYISPQMSLANCLVVQHHPQQQEEKARLGDRNNHYSPVTKEAIAIREWKRRREKKSNNNRPITQIQSLISSGVSKP